MIPLAGLEPAIPRLEAGCLDHWATGAFNSRNRGLNSRPSDYKSDALPLCYRGGAPETVRVGVEPTTSRLTVARSDLLSYRTLCADSGI